MGPCICCRDGAIAVKDGFYGKSLTTKQKEYLLCTSCFTAVRFIVKERKKGKFSQVQKS